MRIRFVRLYAYHCVLHTVRLLDYYCDLFRTMNGLYSVVVEITRTEHLHRIPYNPCVAMKKSQSQSHRVSRPYSGTVSWYEDFECFTSTGSVSFEVPPGGDFGLVTEVLAVQFSG